MFKEGDRVVYTPTGADRCMWINRGMECTVLEVEIENGNRIIYASGGNGLECKYGHKEEDYKLVEKTVDNLKFGDILTNASRVACCDKIQVVGIQGNYITTRDLDISKMLRCFTIEEMKVLNFAIEGNDVKEVTIEEVAKMLNVDVERVRIKD